MESKTKENRSNSGKMPVLFIGHGSPMNIVLKNSFTDRLVDLGKELPRPRAILVISAHWLTDGTYVTCMNKPKTIYDFYGFPDALYRIRYPCPGSPSDAKWVKELVKSTPLECDYEWGLDHASWTILRHMYPSADIPVIEMSLNYSPYNEWQPKSMKHYYDLASELAPLRERNVLIIGSGNIVHNLRLIDFDNIDAPPYDWAVEFDEKVKRNLVSRNHEELLDCKDADRAASLSVPTLDHYLPMICALGLQGKDEPLSFIYEGFQHGSVSMRAFQIG
jgi:4,5-DOPA dioxygenase extradiol